METLPVRPQPHRPIAERVREWIQWFGAARLAVIATSVCAVGAGAFWLLRAPPAPVEASLPYATTSIAASPSTTDPSSPASAAGGAATTLPAPTELVVHVSGAVALPGVYRLTPTARVIDAVTMAGGLAPDADAESINLAAALHDGDRVFVPHLGLPVPTVVPLGGGGIAAAATPATPTGPVDLNTATAEQLDELPGVGPSTAAAIVAHREQNGPFVSVDALGDVRGIGPAKLDALRGLVTV